MYTRVESRFWQDEKMRAVSSDARHLMLYLLTSPHRNILGLYFLPTPYACFDLGWDEQRFGKVFKELLSKGCLKYDYDSHVIFIVNFLKHNPLENQNQVKSAIDKLEQLPQTPLIIDLYEVVKDEKPHYKDLIEWLRKELGKGLFEPLNKRLDEPLGKQEEVKEEVKEEEYIKSALENPTPPTGTEKVNPEDEKPIEPETLVKTPHESVFEHWNIKGIIQHRRMTDKLRRAISVALNDYTDNEIYQSIDNYALILADENKYYWTYKWGLREFLQRGIDKFINLEVAQKNYARVKNNPQQKKTNNMGNFENRQYSKDDIESLYEEV